MNNTIRILGVPMDFGQGRRGVDMGPSAIRYAGLQNQLTKLGYKVIDDGNVSVLQMEELSLQPEEGIEGKAFQLYEVSTVCQRIYDKTTNLIEAGDRIIFVGGDHSMAAGTISSVAKANKPIGVLWIDAHGDLNTPQTSPSGNVHGMPLASLLGYGPDQLVNIGYEGAKLSKEQVVLVGLRDIDSMERELISELGLKAYSMRHVDEKGIAYVMDEILEYLSDFETLHVSFDLDSLEPDIAPGVGTPVPGGFSYREAHLIMEILADSDKVHSVDIVEINPILDQQNATAKIAAEMVTSLFGKSIL